jgi:type I restriction enzyme R subunit
MSGADDVFKNEAIARKKLIDKALQEAGWRPIVGFAGNTKYTEGAVKEYPTAEGPADYVLFDNGKAVAAVEAKKRKLGPQNVLGQAQRYASGFRDGKFEFGEFHLPFIYSTNGDKIWFQDLREQNSRSREIVKFHTPGALTEFLLTDKAAGFEWLAKTANENQFLRPYQKEAIESIEKSLISGKRKMLLSMATGTGKTFVAISQIYRLLKSKSARRILFLVDRRALAAQAV